MRKNNKNKNAPVVATNSDFTVASLFAGGSSLGYHRAGARVLFAVEFDKKKAVIYQKNFPKTQVFTEDIKKLSPEQCLDAVQLQPRQLAILDGSPPCQGFSTAGKQNFDDPRNLLYLEFARFLSAIQPKAFVVENVSGLMMGSMKAYLHNMFTTFRDTGYNVSVFLLNAKNYSVPQSRRRLFLIGSRDDLGIKILPPVPHQKIITVGEALQGCPQGGYFPIRDNLLDEFKKLKEGQKIKTLKLRGFFSYFSRVYWGKPLPTILTAFSKKYPTHIHPLEDRFFSIPELKRLSSFPDDYYLSDDLYLACNVIGNSVPPKLAQAVAESVWSQISRVES